MGRNRYVRALYRCAECGWVATRKDDTKPCRECGGKMEANSQRGGMTYDIAKAVAPKKNGRQPNALPSGGGGGAWAETNEKMGISGTSIFDPVLCELAYRWFCPPGGTVLDPFAGGSVRGVIASRLGRRYLGLDLSARQVKANEEQLGLCDKKFKPVWVVADSQELEQAVDNELGDARFDFIVTSPPYADLERYSDDPRDLSTYTYPKFRLALAEVFRQACGRLADNRFACIVIGDARGADGLLYGLPAHCVQMFEDAGLRLYNDAILETAIASLPVRVRKQFTSSRKLGRCHQYVQVYVKGDPVKATEAIGEVEFGDPGIAVEADEHGERITGIGGEF